MPECLDDRQQDCWEPLFSIAQAAGNTWAKRVEIAALHICGARSEVSSGSQLLSDIRNIFAEKGLTNGDDNMRSAELVAALVALPERPWEECNHGKPLTQNGLARHLKKFDIFTKDVGPKADRVKGYTLESFADAFNRYIPLDLSAHPRTTNENNDLDEKQIAHQDYGCADENDTNPLYLNEVRGCAG